MKISSPFAKGPVAVSLAVLLHMAAAPIALAEAGGLQVGAEVPADTGPDDPPMPTVGGNPGSSGDPPPPTPGSSNDFESRTIRLRGEVGVPDHFLATGALQAFIGGEWGVVCNSGLDDRDAQVACRELGYVGGMVLGPTDTRLSPFDSSGGVSGPFVLENIGCTGDEASIFDCPLHDPSEIDYVTLGYRYGDYSYVNPGKCDPVSDTFAFIACGISVRIPEGAVRLADGAKSPDGDAEFGRLEIGHRGGWGTVCDRRQQFTRSGTFEAAAADVACRELGYTAGARMQHQEGENPERLMRVPVVLSGAACTGNETALAQCPGVDLDADNNNCGHADDVWISCSSGPQPEVDGQLRLSGGTFGPAYEYGRLEIFLQGFWSNICGRFTPESAQVACSALGFDGGVALRFTRPYSRTQNQVLVSNAPVALAAVDCAGGESSLLECQNNPKLVQFCDAGTSSTVITCANTTARCSESEGSTEGAVRLRGGFGTLCDPVHSGFVEVLNEGEWGAICRPMFTVSLVSPEDNLVADVVCRQLGFPHGTRVDPLSARPLRDGDDDDNSRRDYFDNVDEVEEPEGMAWLSEVECGGPESRLLDCDLGPGFQAASSGCSARNHRLHVACRQFPVREALEAVATVDSTAEEGDLRLVEEESPGQGDWVTGRLEMFFEGSWGQVCQTGFGAADAAVACRQLGYGAGTVAYPDRGPAPATTRVFPEVVVTAAGCSGREARLLDCPRQETLESDYDRGCRDSGFGGLRLACVSNLLDGVEGSVRLSRQPGDRPLPLSQYGTLEIFHAGAWGTVCGNRRNGPQLHYSSPAIPAATAEVICRERSNHTGSFIRRSTARFPTPRPPWIASVRCSGSEDEVADCELAAFGETAGCGPLISVTCTPFSAVPDNFQVRLINTFMDEDGAWEFGMLQVRVNGVWGIIEETVRSGNRVESFGRRGAQVACRSLGYATGAQILAGRSSPVRTDSLEIVVLSGVSCEGSEASLAECGISLPSAYDPDYGDDDYPDGPGGGAVPSVSAVVLICATPSGCTQGEPPAPQQGDIRLVPLRGTAAATAPCDDVHFGGLEIFNDGDWGVICVGDFTPNAAPEPEDFVLDAQVACRELGFPFGTVMDTAEVDDAYEGQFDGRRVGREEEVVWATRVVCKGTEERLRDCTFPENFSDRSNRRGLSEACAVDPNRRLGIICRQFPGGGLNFIRR